MHYVNSVTRNDHSFRTSNRGTNIDVFLLFEKQIVDVKTGHH